MLRRACVVIQHETGVHKMCLLLVSRKNNVFLYAFTVEMMVCLFNLLLSSTFTILMEQVLMCINGQSKPSRALK